MAADQPKALDAWSGEFGDRYTERNAASADAVRGRTQVWSEVFRLMVGDMPTSALEVGPNVPPELVTLANDPQTSGGLLAALPRALLKDLHKDLVDAGVNHWPVGRVEASDTGVVRLT